MNETERTPITQFLLRNGNLIEASWFTPDELIITFKPQVSGPGILRFMVELITQCHPTSAIRVDDHTVRLGF